MAASELVYLDHAATTPMAAEVVDAMLPWLSDGFGNASASYRLGRHARAAVGAARDDIATCLGCAPDALVFTSGGTESDNLAIRGVVRALRREGRAIHLVATAVEHPAVAATLGQLAADDAVPVTVVPVDAHGRVSPDAIMDAVRPDTALVSVMLANNEVGTVQPVGDIGRRLGERGILFHTDAVQAAAWLDLDVDALRVDLMSLSAHKVYGPKGIGALYVRPGTPLEGVLTGGGQEGGLRPGTENVAGIVGFGAALALARAERGSIVPRVAALRDRLVAALEALPGISLTGHPTLRLPNHASFVVKGVAADVALMGLDMEGICASSGSACASGSRHPSAVLTAMGLPDDLALGALRFSLGRRTSERDIERLLDVLPPLLSRLSSD